MAIDIMFRRGLLLDQLERGEISRDEFRKRIRAAVRQWHQEHECELPLEAPSKEEYAEG
jgi:hypothetical protein